jgi:VCBS repeat-containing protein
VRDRAEQASSSTSAALPFTDPDIGDAHAVAVKSGEGAIGTLTATIGKEPDSDGPGSIGWTYTVDHKAVAELAKGQSRAETFTVTVGDGQGGTAEQAVTITVRGSETFQPAPTGDPEASRAGSATVRTHTDPGGTISPVPRDHTSADSVPVVDTHHGHGLTGFEI